MKRKNEGHSVAVAGEKRLTAYMIRWGGREFSANDQRYASSTKIYNQSLSQFLLSVTRAAPRSERWTLKSKV